MGKMATPLGSLGLKALLQLQDQNVDVSKELRFLGHPELIRFVPVVDNKFADRTTQAAPPSGGKYHVSAQEMRTEDGIVFDSKLERGAYVVLKTRNINFEVHPTYVLQEAFRDPDGKMRRPIIYEADFLLKGKDGKEYVVDMKGMLLDVFKLKEKLFTAKYNRKIHCFKSAGELVQFLVENNV